MKQPAIMFYVGDWMKAADVRSLSYAARGLWFDIICLMHDADRRGYLEIAGKQMSSKTLAKITGGTEDEVNALMAEILESGVVSIDESGTWYSRRMSREFEISQARAYAGSKGGSKRSSKTQATLEDEDEDEDVIEDGLKCSEESPRETKPRPRDLIFETVQELWYGGKVTEPHRGIANRLTADFKSLGATPDEIRRRLGRMKAEWSAGIAKTGTALVKNWHLFAPAGSIQSSSTTLASLHRQLAEAKAASREHAVARLESEIAALEAKQGGIAV